MSHGARFAGIPQDTLLQLLVGCDEILANVIKHGYGLEKPPGPLWCGSEVSPSLIHFIIRHQGAGITTDAAQADARSRREGGLGLLLVRRVFSHVHFCTQISGIGDRTASRHDSGTRAKTLSTEGPAFVTKR